MPAHAKGVACHAKGVDKPEGGHKSSPVTCWKRTS